ncbi:MAG: carbonic anhydrase family protein [Burkholderiales bacterium]|nr:carbonic anhydrase family protein [Burkholderiales bacterium]
MAAQALKAAALATLWAAAAATAAPTLCERGLRQSPIDITATWPASGPALRFGYTGGPARIVNDGHTVRVHFAGASRLFVGDEAMKLGQFHFHRPGGDEIGGEAFPLAMHYLHKSRSGQLVALVVLFRLGAENKALAALLPLFPAQGERRVPSGVVDPAALLPTDKGYYAYDGSLTAPPCTEGVRWIVLRQALEISPAQMAALARLFPVNARAVQPLNGRIVIAVP